MFLPDVSSPSGVIFYGVIAGIIVALIVWFIKKLIVRFANNSNQKVNYRKLIRRLFNQRKEQQGSDIYRSLLIELDSDKRFFVDMEIVLKDSDKENSYSFSYIAFIDRLIKRKPFHHALLVSEGGMGKTTVLIRIWEHCFKNNRYPPTIFIILKDCPEGLFSKIKQQYEITKADLLSSRRSPKKPNFIILLDGINEVDINQVEYNVSNHQNRTSLLEELGELFRSGGCLCIMTSRSENFSQIYLFQKYNLQIKSGEVNKFLEHHKLNPTDEMRQILKTPMMLNLFQKTFNITSGYPEDTFVQWRFRGVRKSEALVTEGEILWNFYRCQLIKVVSTHPNGDIQRLRLFALERLLPEIACQMCYKGNLTMTFSDLQELIKFCINKYPTIDGIKDITYIYSIFEYELGLLRLEREYERFSFIHQEFRDFFAAVYLINEAEDIMKGQQPVVYPNRQPPDRVQRFFIGAIDHEFLLNILEDNNYAWMRESKSTAANVIGDLYYYKADAKFKFPSRLTASIPDCREELYKQALEYYHIADKLGNPMGSWNLGLTYRQLYKDLHETEYANLALKYTRKACEKDLPYGYNQMGILFLEGIGVKKNIDSAIYYFKKGITYKVAHSYNLLGRLYENEAIKALNNNLIVKAKEFFVQAFIIFYEQSIVIGEEYAMNRVSCYFYEGIPKKDGKSSIASDLLGPFNEEYLKLLPKEEKYQALLSDPEGKIESILIRAAHSQNKHAIERYNRLFIERKK